jgi:hypothetical protein
MGKKLANLGAFVGGKLLKTRVEAAVSSLVAAPLSAQVVMEKVYTALSKKNMRDVSTAKILSLLEQILRQFATIIVADIRLIKSIAQCILENGLVEGLLKR